MWGLQNLILISKPSFLFFSFESGVTFRYLTSMSSSQPLSPCLSYYAQNILLLLSCGQISIGTIEYLILRRAGFSELIRDKGTLLEIKNNSLITFS